MRHRPYWMGRPAGGARRNGPHRLLATAPSPCSTRGRSPRARPPRQRQQGPGGWHPPSATARADPAGGRGLPPSRRSGLGWPCICLRRLWQPVRAAPFVLTSCARRFVSPPPSLCFLASRCRTCDLEMNKARSICHCMVISIVVPLSSYPCV